MFQIKRGHDFPTHHSVKSAGEVMVLVLCTSPDGALYLYQASKYLRGFWGYWADTICDGQTDRRIFRHTDGQLWEKQRLPHLDNIIIQWKLVLFQI